MRPITEATLSPDFQPAGQTGPGKNFTNRLPAIQRGSKPGDTVTFKFKGTTCAIYDVIGPDCGQVIVTLDEQAPKTVARFDSYCTYWRLGRFAIANDLPDQVHTVKIEIDSKQPDKAAILAQRHNTIDKPEKYDATAFYPGAILLVGELVK
jgi:hypothetical protein